MRRLSLIFFICWTLWSAQSAKILFIGVMPSHSHHTLVVRLAKELADKGHQVTAITPYPQKTQIPNYQTIVVKEVDEFMEDIRNTMMARHSATQGTNLGIIVEMSLTISNMTLQNPNVQKLLNSDATFDVVIMEQFLNEALFGFAHRFEAPLIVLSANSPNSMNNYLFANPAPSSYIPNLFGAFSKHMSFWQRLQNFLFNQFAEVFREIIYLPKHRQLFKTYIKSDVELDDVLYNVSLLLSNSHVSVNDAVPRVPGIIEIGGFHLSPSKPLSEELQKFLDGAKDGVVLFSMGSNLKSKDLAPEARKALLNAFSKIKQKVLWKFEEELPDLPDNVKIMKWVPQQDVLAHPNVKAFISHGGLLSTIETVYHGVPIIGIPVFGDQKSNIAAAINNGYAVSVPLDEISEEKLSLALNEILNNPKYKDNVQRRSRVMKDQPLKPLDSAVYWVEHVIRHKGAPHLRSAGLDLKWYQREMVDVIGFLVLAVVALSTVIYIGLKKVCNWLCKKGTKKQKVKRN